MNIYQAGYYRLGLQGEGSGWSIVSPSEGMPRIAKDGFCGMASRLIEIKNSAREDVAATNMGIFQFDRFVYFMHVNYLAKGQDARGVSYVHGYCVNKRDYYELCKEPLNLFGISKDCFPMEYDPSVNPFPVVSHLSTEKKDIQQLRDKYHLNDEAYRSLIISAIAALDEYDGPLCIITSQPAELFQEIYCDIMYLIMSMIPTHLRIKFTGCSSGGMGAKLYISDHAEGDHVFHLESFESRVRLNGLKKYRFLSMYNTMLSEPSQIIYALNKLDAFINEAFGSSAEEMDCDQMEAAFGNFFPEALEDREYVSMVALKILSLKPSATRSIYDYLTKLIKRMNDYKITISNASAKKNLDSYLTDAAPSDFREECHRFKMNDLVLLPEREAFERLYSYKQKNLPEYNELCQRIHKEFPAFYEKYYIQKELPDQLTSLKKLEDYIKENLVTYSELLCNKLFELLQEKISETFGLRDGLLEKKELIEQANHIGRLFLDGSDKRLIKFENQLYQRLWDEFDVDRFCVADISLYKELKIEETAKLNQYYSGSSSAIEKTCRVIAFLEDPAWYADVKECADLLYSDKYFSNSMTRDAICGHLRDRLTRLTVKDLYFFDISLCLYIDPIEKTFRLRDWIDLLSETRRMNQYLSDRNMLEHCINNAYMLKYNSNRDLFFECMEKRLNRDKGTVEGSFELACYVIMGGKEPLDLVTAEDRRDFVFAIRQYMITALTIVALGVFEKNALWHLKQGHEYFSFIFLGAECIMLVFLFIVHLVRADGLRGMAEDAAINSKIRWVIYLTIIVVVGILGAFIVLAKAALAAGIVFAVLTAACMSVSVYHFMIAED